MSDENLLTRREFTVESALAMLAGVTITISGCGDDDNATPAPTPPPATDKTGAVTTDAGHTHQAVITAAQLTAGNAISVTLTGAATHTHTVALSQAELSQINAGTRVQKTSSTDNAHSHTVTFN
ncbi:MAG TPA: hypothetical protein VFE69_16100 [Ilumatobacteraceae bacterium]|jgi:hypothetical protein|nr:hypothetical protein [Ilumatobacteraceae bacterium]